MANEELMAESTRERKKAGIIRNDYLRKAGEIGDLANDLFTTEANFRFMMGEDCALKKVAPQAYSEIMQLIDELKTIRLNMNYIQSEMKQQASRVGESEQRPNIAQIEGLEEKEME